MKKLMVAIGAAAAALGLFAADTGSSFESSTGVITAAPSSDTENYGFWAVGATAPDKADVAEYGEAPKVTAGSDRPSQWSVQNKYLDVKTTFGNPLTRKAKADGSAYGWSGKNTIYFDSLVQFTHCDYDMTIADYSGAKIVVYTQLNETEDETNLVIKAASDAIGKAKSYVIEGFEPYDEKDGWARLTLKAHKNITTNSGEPVMAFEVFVNGESVTSTAAKTDVSAIANLTDTGKELAKEGKLFLSLSQANSDIVSASFDGQGKIDDLTFTTTVPNFSAAKDPEFFKIYAGENVASFTVDGVAGVSGAAILLDGTPQTYEVVATYANGYQAGKWTTTGSATVEDGTSFVVTADGATGTIVAKAAFATLTYTDSEGNPQTVSAENVGAAISAIPSGATNVKITLAQNHTTGESVNLSSDITIDLNGKTFTYMLGTGYMFVLGTGKTLTVMDSNLNDNGKLAAPNSEDGLIDFQDGALSISNGTFDGFIMGENAVITGGKFTHNPTDIAVAVPGYEWVKGQDNYYTLKPATATLTIPALSYVMVSATTGTPAVVIAEAAGAYTVDIGAEVAVTWTATGNYFFGNNTQTTNETVTVGAEGATLVEPATQEGKAKKGTTFFLTLQDALNDSAAETITLLANGSIGGASKAETIDLNGFTLDIVAPTVDYDFKVIDTKETGKFTYDTGSSLTVNGAVLDLSGINFSQTAGCTGGFVLNNEDATVKLPAGAGAYPAWTAAIVSAVQGAKVVDAGVTYTKYADGWSTVAKAVARVGEDDRLYATIEGAVAGAEADETITLLANCAIAKTTATFALSINKNLTLDARNYTLTGPSGQYGIIVENGATFTFVGGTITPEKDTSNSILSVGYEEDDKWTKSAGYLVVNGGTIRGNGKSGNAIAAQAGTVTITSGSIVNVGARAVKAECSATAVINGGTIGDLNMTKPACYCAGNGAITINGGVINGDCNAGVTIPGTSTATFDRDQSAFCAVGYLTKLNTAEPARYEVVEAVAVTGVELSESAVTLAPEAQETLVATIAPVNADVKSTTWKTSDAGVATVANGVVTAVAAGSATITVEVVDYCGNTKTATCAVTVKSAEPEPVVPGEPVVVTDPVAATNAFNTADDATKAKYVKAPNVGDKLDATQKAAYAHYFKAVPNGGNAIMFVFDEAKSAELKTTVDAQLGKVDITGTSETEIDAVAGFFYRFVGGTEVGTITTGGTAAQAGVSGKVSLTKPDLGATTKAFYKVEVRAYTWVK